MIFIAQFEFYDLALIKKKLKYDLQCSKIAEENYVFRQLKQIILSILNTWFEFEFQTGNLKVK